MSRLTWNSTGSRYYEAGVDRGVLYVGDKPGVVWNGLTSVREESSGGENRSYFIDGVKYLNVSSGEHFEATITAYTYPDEFAQCEGLYQPRSGLFLTRQRRKPFGLTYRTRIGNDLDSDRGYKLHLIYNALAAPSERSYSSLGEESDPIDFSWNITARPPVLSGYRPTAHIVVDSRHTDPLVLSKLEDILYGTEVESPRLPDFTELLEVFDTISNLTIVDNGDGTWTATAPYDVIRMLDESTFEITSPTAIFIDDDTYTISSE